NTALNDDHHRADAAICWVNALWQDGGDVPQWAHTWAAAEAKEAAGDGLAAELDRLLAKSEPSPSNLRAVAACVSWAVRQALPERVRDWVARLKPKKKDPATDGEDPQTDAYACLILAFGLARVGESNECQRLYEQARQALSGREEVHAVLLEAFGYRIEQALQ